MSPERDHVPPSRRRRQAGFTLVEMSIAALLSALVAASLTGVLYNLGQNAGDAGRNSELQSAGRLVMAELVLDLRQAEAVSENGYPVESLTALRTIPGLKVVRPADAEELARKLDAFAKLVEASPADLALYNRKKFGLRNFEDEDARDLYQLMTMYYGDSASPVVRAAAREVITVLAEKLVARNEAKGYKSKDAWGLSIHFPYFYMNYREKYEHLSLSRDTRWDEMIKAAVFYK